MNTELLDKLVQLIIELHSENREINVITNL